MRSFVDEKQSPLLWSSTYHAGEFLDPVAVAEAKAKRKAKKMAGIAPTIPKDEAANASPTANSDDGRVDLGSGGSELISPKQMAIEGFKAQSEMVIDSLDRLITAWEERKESVVVEGVHLSLNFVVSFLLVCVPFSSSVITSRFIVSFLSILVPYADGANEETSFHHTFYDIHCK